MAVNFVFKKKDDEKAYADSKAQPLVDFVIEHMEFLPYLCECVLSNKRIDSLSRKDEDGEDMFIEYINTFEFDYDNSYDYINKFAELAKEAYNTTNCEDEYQTYLLNTTGKIDTYHDFCVRQLGYVRGRILEMLLEYFIYKRYKASRDRLDNYSLQFEVGCIISLNNKELIYTDRKTVDIAGWDGKMGEFYEAKVNPERFDEKVLYLLTLIKNELEKQKINAIVGCVSMEDRDKMVACINKVIEEKEIIYNDNIQVYGKDELGSLLLDRPNIVA